MDIFVLVTGVFAVAVGGRTMRVRGVKGRVLGKGVPGNRYLQCVSCDSHGVNLLRSSLSIHVRWGFPHPDKDGECGVEFTAQETPWSRLSRPPTSTARTRHTDEPLATDSHSRTPFNPTTQCRNPTERLTSIAERIHASSHTPHQRRTTQHSAKQ